MQISEAIAITITDLLVGVGFAAACWLFYLAFNAGPASEMSLTLGAIAAAVIPLPISITVHQHYVRARLSPPPGE